MKYEEIHSFDTLNVGDQVVIESGLGITSTRRTGIVVRTTKTLLIVNNETYGWVEKFLKSNGHLTPEEKGRFAWVHRTKIVGIPIKENENVEK